MAVQTDLEKLQRMRAEYEGWRGTLLDDAIAELAALRAVVRHGISCKHPSCQMAGRCSYAGGPGAPDDADKPGGGSR